MKRVWLFFGLVFAITWGVGLLYFTLGDRLAQVFGPLGTTNPLFYVAVSAPTIAALTLSALQRGGLRDLFGRLITWRIGLQWYLLPTLGLAALCYLARLASAHFGGPPAVNLLTDVGWTPSLLAAGALAFVVDPGPLGEEPGWRGYALPRMEQRWSGWLAASVLGAIWGIWHLPAFYTSTLPQSAFGFPLFLIQSVALSVLMAWCVNHARGSLIPAILLHWSINRFGGFDPATAPYTAALLVAAAGIVIAAGGRELGRRHMPAPP